MPEVWTHEDWQSFHRYHRMPENALRNALCGMDMHTHIFAKRTLSKMTVDQVANVVRVDKVSVDICSWSLEVVGDMKIDVHRNWYDCRPGG